jgi:hypothetical protein
LRALVTAIDGCGPGLVGCVLRFAPQDDAIVRERQTVPPSEAILKTSAADIAATVPLDRDEID